MQISVVLRFKEGEDFKGMLNSFMVPPDLVAFERTYNVSAGSLRDLANQRAEYMLWLIWAAAKREGVVSTDFDAFLESLADSPELGEPELDPTEAPPSP